MADTNGDAPAFDMAEMGSTLPATAGNMNAEAAALAREKGWAEPQRYNYDAYNAASKDDPAIADAETWGSNAAKYEWNEEYGDVGPPNPDLEKMLFRDDYIVREGEHMEK